MFIRLVWKFYVPKSIARNFKVQLFVKMLERCKEFPLLKTQFKLVLNFNIISLPGAGIDFQ